MSEPTLFVFWFEFANWLLERSEDFPKRVRHSFVNRIDNLTLDILEEIATAAYTKKDAKLPILQGINIKLERLRLLLRLACKRGYLHQQSLEYAMRQLEESGNMVGGWIKSRESV